jgi:hypothetical protein
MRGSTPIVLEFQIAEREIMIEVLGGVGLIAFAISSLAIGVRLLILGRRTRGIPELAIGLGFVIGCVVGYVPETIVLSTDFMSPEREAAVLAVTQVAIRIAAISVLVFTRYVFRSQEAWAKGFMLLLVIALGMSWVAFPYTRIYAATSRDIFWYDFFAVSRSLALAWGAAESLSYYAKSRRRMRLGLANALVTNRFLLWGIGLASLTLLMASTLLASALGVDPAVSGWVLFESFAGLVGASTLWLTFFPGKAYRAFVERRADRLRQS